MEAGSQEGNSILDAAGPETFTLIEFLRHLASSMSVRKALTPTPPSIAHAFTRSVGFVIRDLALTRDEVDGLLAVLLTSEDATTGTTRLSDWLEGNAVDLGRRYVSELWRNWHMQHLRRTKKCS